jgi:hypothetical protein
VVVDPACECHNISLSMFFNFDKIYYSGFKFSQLEMSKPMIQICSMLLISSSLEIAEVVLLMLIESFRFYPSKKEVFWRMTGITSPVVIGDDSGPQLPIIVERVL